jgi:hypothetical protein
MMNNLKDSLENTESKKYYVCTRTITHVKNMHNAFRVYTEYIHVIDE